MNKGNKVGFIDSVHPILWDRLTQMGFLCEDLSHKTTDEILPVLSQYIGVVIRSKFKFDQTAFNHSNNLKFIARSGSGMENIDLEIARSLNIFCFNSPEGNRDAVAEHVLGMILMLFNKLKFSDAQVRKGIWDREGNRGLELLGKTFGIIGYGVMGKAVAQRLSGFGCKVIAYDKYKSNFTDEYAKEVTWEVFCKESDIVSLHVNFLPQNNYLVNQDFFNGFSKQIYFINSARGKCVNTASLVEALKNKKVFGACLDVLEFESVSFENELTDPVFNELTKFSQVILSPHVAGWTVESYQKLSSFLADKIEQNLDSFLPSKNA